MAVILFIDTTPVAYQVYKAFGSYYLKPASNPAREIEAPILYAIKFKNAWIIKGTSDENLKEQLKEKINELQHNHLPLIDSSAAI